MELEEAIKRLSMKATTSSVEAPDYPNCIVMKKDLITILNHLEKYRDLYVQSLANNLNQNLKNREMSNEQLEALNEGWKLEVEKQEKMIELMTNFIYHIGYYEDSYGNSCAIIQDSCFKNKTTESCEQCIKQYFEKKAEESK